MHFFVCGILEPISTAHAAVAYQELADWARVIVDTRNVMAGFKTGAGKVWKA
ncbi:MAG: hypothetical protein P4N60_07360 [Verrucomicrobiae bacterium]|nr:hypothetical protein [Verrucomicrobiae bacterium]